jgi:hypothetical protein
MVFHSADSLMAKGSGCYGSFGTDECGRGMIKYFRSEC